MGNPPTNTIFNWMESGVLTDQQVSGTLTWNPLPRLYLQGTGSYVWDKTETPAGDIILTPNTVVTVNNFYNNYWQAGASLGFVIDNKTNLHVDYSYYKSDNYESNFIAALPYGMTDREYTISAGIDREITKNVRLSLKYSYYDYTNATSGGHNNYTAHAVFSGLQFRF
jgi:opacity protein-like surface antigen